jgi:23S rRNA pseudouridine1911/1915/1917 synthase
MSQGDSNIDARMTEAQSGMRLDRALADVLPDLSRERIKSLILGGHVRGRDGKAATNPSMKVAPESRFALDVPAPRAADAQPEDIPLVIAYEDAHLIVVDKAAGMVVHPAAGNLDGTLVNALLAHCKGQLSGIGGVARPGIVHRIDKDTSGLMVVAKSDQAHEGLARQFKDHSIRRVYQAIVNGLPTKLAGTVDTWIGRSDGDRKKMAVQREGRGKHAITHYKVVQRMHGSALIECRLETGRTHQVRVHMAHLGHPLLGDPAYGRQTRHRELLQTLGFQRQALHAARLGFIHPVDGSDLDFASSMPRDMQELFSHLNV